MNILFTPSDNDRYHGAFLSMAKLAFIMQKEYGYNVLVVLPYEGDGKELLDSYGIRSVVIRSYDWVIPITKQGNPKTILKQIAKSILNFRAIRRIKQIIRTEKIDVAHNNTSWAYVGAAAALSTNTPLVWHIREFLEEDQKLCIWNKKAGYRLISKADRIITISKSLEKKYSTKVNPKHVVMIYNGIDPQRFTFMEHQPFQNSLFRFLIVGTVEEWKGQGDAVKACIMLLKEGVNSFELIIAGNDQSSYAKQLKALISREKAEEHIRFIGPTNTPEEYYKQADITFMCSCSEAFGRVTVEAMFAGSLVIGAKSAGTLDIIQDGETGLFYKPGDVSDLKDKIFYAINHPEESHIVAKQGQTDALQRFTAEANAMNVNAIYEEVLQERSK